MPVEANLNPHIAEEMAHLFTAADAEQVEEEFLGLLAALVRSCQPKRVLALHRPLCSSPPLSYSSIWYAAACNGFTEIVYDIASVDAKNPVGLAFLDQLPLPANADTLAQLIEGGLLTPRAVIAIHDTSRCRTLKDGSLDPEAAEFWERMERNVIRRFKPRAVLELPLSRGLTLIQI